MHRRVDGDPAARGPERNAVALISEEMSGSVASSGFTRLRLQPECSPSVWFIFAFLKSRYAIAQLMRRNRGSMYPAVLNDDVFDLVVPTPQPALKSAVSKQVQEGLQAHKRFFEAKRDIEVSLETYLQATLGDPPPSPLLPGKYKNSISILQSRLFFDPKGDLRFDADFFRKEYLDFVQRMSAKSSTVRLGSEFVAFSGNPVSKGNDSGYLLKQAALSQFGVNWNALHPITLALAGRNDRIKVGDILLACTAHEIYYVGRRVDYVDDIPQRFVDNAICVPDVIIIRRKADVRARLTASFVSAFLRTPWGLHQVQRLIRGLRGGHVYGGDIERNVLVPEPDSNWLAEFETRFLEMRRERRKAIAAIKKGVRQVENWLDTSATKPAADQLSRSTPDGLELESLET
jgi:hypothetical protein